MKATVSKKTAKANNKAYLKKQTGKVLGNNKSIIGKLLNEQNTINKQTLQLMAFLFMTVDHIGMMFFPDIEVLREVGRLAFPIFCFLLTEGFVHTHDRSKYYLRLAGAALISEIPYNLAVTGNILDFSKQNVMFELMLGFIALSIYDVISKMFDTDRYRFVGNVLIWSFTIAMGVIAEISHCDYGLYGILLIMMFYFFRKYPEKKRFINYLIMMTALSLFFYAFGNQIFCILSLIPIYFYNSEPYKRIKKVLKYKYLNYFYYPVHFIVLYSISEIICFTKEIPSV